MGYERGHGWQAASRLTPGGQPCYSDLAFEMGLMLRLAFHLPLRQTEGLPLPSGANYAHACYWLR